MQLHRPTKDNRLEQITDEHMHEQWQQRREDHRADTKRGREEHQRHWRRHRNQRAHIGDKLPTRARTHRIQMVLLTPLLLLHAH